MFVTSLGGWFAPPKLLLHFASILAMQNMRAQA